MVKWQTKVGVVANAVRFRRPQNRTAADASWAISYTVVRSAPSPVVYIGLIWLGGLGQVGQLAISSMRIFTWIILRCILQDRRYPIGDTNRAAQRYGVNAIPIPTHQLTPATSDVFTAMGALGALALSFSLPPTCQLGRVPQRSEAIDPQPFGYIGLILQRSQNTYGAGGQVRCEYFTSITVHYRTGQAISYR